MRQPVTRFAVRYIALLASALAAVRGEAQPEVFDPDAIPRRRNIPSAEEKIRRPISLDGGASINPELLTQIQDDTVGLTYDDREAYFRILKLTEKLDRVELRTLAAEFKEDRHAVSPRYRRRPVEKFPTFVDLFQHPAEYRGRPVTLHGKFRRLVTYDAGKNDQGFEVLHEGWFYADDGQGNPAVVIFTEKPEGLLGGGDIEEEISVTGYFLKMYGYSAQDTTRRAPLILAHTVRWHEQKPISVWHPAPQTYLAFSVGVLVIALLIGLFVRESQLQTAAWKESRRADLDVFVPFENGPSDHSLEPSRNGSTSGAEPHH